MKKTKRILYFFVVIALLVSVNSVLAYDPGAATTTVGVTPQLFYFPADRVCAPGSTLISDQFQNLNSSGSATYIIDGKEVTVNITFNASTNTFDFEVIGGVMSTVFVKAKDYLKYSYNPAVSMDTGLHANLAPNGRSYQQVSHVDFCIIPQADPLEVSKTASGTFDRTVVWDLEKTVDIASHSAEAGENAGTSTWTIEATKSETLDNYLVEGEISIYNPNDYPVSFSVSDTLDDDTFADVTCPVYVVAGMDTVTCTYEALPVDDSATLNTVTVTSLTSGVEGDSASADILWTENLIGDEEVTLSDPDLVVDTLISSSTTLNIPELFVCSADASFYKNGQYSFDVPNTAYLDGDFTDLDASAKVTVNCTLLPLEPTKTANASFDRIVEWDLDKSVAPAYHMGLAGETAGSSIWEVVATKSETLDNFMVTGTISIYNPSSITQSFSVSDMLNDSTDATVECLLGQTVAAGGTLTCTYEAYPSDDSATLNTATVTALGNPAQYATAQVSFVEKLVGYDSGILSDPRVGLIESISGSTTKTFNESFVCPANASLYVNGFYSFTEVNKAFLNGNIGLEASAEVLVDCYLDPLEVSKTAEGSFDRTITWTLDKSVSPASHSGIPGSTFDSIWSVVVGKSDSLGNYMVSGIITIDNPASIPQTFSVSDVLNDGTVASVTCLTNTVAAGGQVTCSYVAYPAGGTATLNTATVSAPGNADQQGTATVSFVENIVGYDSGMLYDDRFSFSQAVSGDTTVTFPETFVCPVDTSMYVNGVYEFQVVNTAVLNSNINLSDSATVTVTCANLQRPSIEISDVVINSAARGSASVTGSFAVLNASGGDATIVTLGEVWMEFISRADKGVKTSHSAVCTFDPEATGAVLNPHEKKTFGFSCTLSPEVPMSANELTAIVYVNGALNQGGEYRDMLWRDTSSPFKFE